ncbi:MAG: hypothetical protein ACFFFG_15255 [Candidatus Thorarchaeota archaeon]
MSRDILAEEQLKFEIIRVLSRYFLRQIEDLVRTKTGAFFPVEKIENIELGRRLGKRRELQLATLTVRDAISDRKFSFELAFKFHADQDAAIKEGNGALWLGDVLKNNFKVHTPQLLYLSRESSLLIYEGVQAKEFYDSELGEHEKLLLAGMALPYVHGIFKQRVQVDRYLHLISGVTAGLRMSPDEKTEFNSLFKPFLRHIGISEAGGNCFGDFHPGNIMFQHGGDINASTSNTGNVVVDHTHIFLIDPAFLDNEGNVDRTEDIGTFFSKIASNEWLLNQSFDTSIGQIEQFVKGYNYITQMNGTTLQDYYVDGKPSFDFQIGLGILLDTLYKMKTPGGDFGTKTSTNIEAAKQILTRQPFEAVEPA